MPKLSVSLLLFAEFFVRNSIVLLKKTCGIKSVSLATHGSTLFHWLQSRITHGNKDSHSVGSSKLQLDWAIEVKSIS